MQAQAHKQKKDRLPTIVCPRCGAVNLTVQTQCGRCSFVFPRAVHTGSDPFRPAGSSSPAPGGAPSAGRAPLPSMPPSPRGGPLRGGSPPPADDADLPAPPPPPKAPKTLSGKGVSEGHLKSRGQWRQCPHCGADALPDARRCIRCGTKLGSA